MEISTAVPGSSFSTRRAEPRILPKGNCQMLPKVSLRDWNGGEELRADVDAPRRVVRRAQAVRGDTWKNRLYVFRQHLVAAFEQRPGARRMHQGERCARREARHVVGRAARMLHERLHVVEQRGCDVDA